MDNLYPMNKTGLKYLGQKFLIERQNSMIIDFAKPIRNIILNKAASNWKKINQIPKDEECRYEFDLKEDNYIILNEVLSRCELSEKEFMDLVIENLKKDFIDVLIEYDNDEHILIIDWS